MEEIDRLKLIVFAKIHKRRTKKNIEKFDNPENFKENNYVFSGTCLKCGKFMWYDLDFKKYRPYEFDGDVFIHECGERYSPKKFKQLKDCRDYSPSCSSTKSSTDYKMSISDIIISGVFIALICIDVGFIISIIGVIYDFLSFIWNGSMFDKFMVLCIDMGCFIFGISVIYGIFHEMCCDKNV